MKTKIIPEKHILEVREGRVYELMLRYYKMVATDQGHWREWFNTENYQRRKEHCAKLIDQAHYHIRKYVTEQHPDVQSWHIHRKGSNRSIDVSFGDRQWYEIELHDKTLEVEGKA